MVPPVFNRRRMRHVCRCESTYKNQGTTMQATLVGIDLAKDVFQLHGNDAKGKTVFRKKVRRGQLLVTLATLPRCTIAMEACSGAHWLARKAMALGHTVVLIAPQFVKPFVKTNKSDAADAEAICEAASRPNMRSVCVKSAWHLDVQAIHRVRSCRVRRRTALCNEVRALFFEHGVTVPKGIDKLRRLLPGLLADDTSELTSTARRLVEDLVAELIDLDGRIKAHEDELARIIKQSSACRRLLDVAGVGPLTATAFVAACPDPAHFRNGRHFAAYVGLVPRHSGTGGVNRLGGISRRGDTYLRGLLIHGARSVVQRSSAKRDRRSTWINGVKERRGFNKATVATANKTARVLWALLRKGEDYKAA